MTFQPDFAFKQTVTGCIPCAYDDHECCEIADWDDLEPDTRLAPCCCGIEVLPK